MSNVLNSEDLYNIVLNVLEDYNAYCCDNDYEREHLTEIIVNRIMDYSNTRNSKANKNTTWEDF